MLDRTRQRLVHFESLLQPRNPSTSPRLGASSTPHPLPDAQQGTRARERDRQHQLRHASLQSIPDAPPHLRPAVYRSLLSLPTCPSASQQYSSFLSEISSRISSLPPPSPATPPERYDKLLREIQRDVERTFGGLAWFAAPPDHRDTKATADGDEQDALWTRIRLLDEADQAQSDELARREKEKKREQALQAADASPSTPSPTFETTSGTAESATGAAPSNDTTPKSPPTPSPRSRRPQTRQDILLRPLFVYAFLNPGVSYVQGMSYLAAILFFVFSSPSTASSAAAPSDSDSTNPEIESESDHLEPEALTFFALGALLSQLRDLYTPTLDGTSSPRLLPSSSSSHHPNSHNRGGSASTLPTGLGATVARFNALLMVMDPRVAEALDRKGVRVEGLVMRWWTTMFANEFHLPDVVRIWDRLLSLYPADGDSQAGEALSPLLGHLIDLGLAVVLLEKQKIVSPYARLPEILTALQAPALNAAGADIDRLLRTAWDVRERRLGRSKPTVAHTKTSSISSDLSLSRSPSVFAGFGKKLFGAAAAAAAASSSSSSSSTMQRKDSSSGVAPSDVAEFELNAGSLDDRSSSVAGSDVSFSRPRFASFAFSSPRTSQDLSSLSSNFTVIEGKVLPPPPARIDEHHHQQQQPQPQQHATIASLIEEELAADTGLQSPDPDQYGVEDEDEEDAEATPEEDEGNPSSSFAQKAVSSWGGLKSSLTRFASSDTAAQLQKRATNLQLAAAASASSAQTRLQDFQSSDTAAALYKAQTNAQVKAQMLAEQVQRDAALSERMIKLREAAQGAGGRLMATGASERGEREGGGAGGPRETPFTPPGMRGATISPLGSPRLSATGSSVDLGRGGVGSNHGPKPLLLSGSARKAENRSDETTSETSSRRSSMNNWGARSPSLSPVIARTLPLLSPPDLSIPPLSRSSSRGSHGRSASHFDTPTRVNGTVAVGAGAFRPRSSSVAQDSHYHYPSALPLQDEDSPITSSRIREASSTSTLRRGVNTSSTSTATRGDASSPTGSRALPSGRGWQLSDAPIRPRLGEGGGAGEEEDLPPLEVGFDPSRISESLEPVREVGLAEGAEFIAKVKMAGLSLHEAEEEEGGRRREDEPFSPPSSQPQDREAPFSPPALAPEEPGFSPPPQDEPLFPPKAEKEPFSLPLDALPPRRSSLNASTSHPPARTSSLTSTSQSTSSDLTPSLSISTVNSTSTSSAPTSDTETPTPLSTSTSTGPSLSRSKIVRRPPAQRKRTSKSSISVDSNAGSMGPGANGSVDMLGPEARRVASEFLTRSGSGAGGNEVKEDQVGSVGEVRTGRG
ncbi:hypothetical protein JCM11641_008288 [Rhodosporidiobolus odoratus]